MIDPPARSQKRTQEAGFSLLEILVVLSIVMAAAMIALPSMQRHPRTLELQTLSIELASRLREARAIAIADGQPVDVLIDAPARRYVIGASRTIQLPADIALSATTARSTVTDIGGARIRFHPDGSSTGGAIRLTRQARSVDIGIAWLTGAVTLSGL